MQIVKGNTYTLKQRVGRKVTGQSSAVVNDITVKGRGHTVHYTSSKKSKTLSLRRFAAQAA